MSNKKIREKYDGMFLPYNFDNSPIRLGYMHFISDSYFVILSNKDIELNDYIGSDTATEYGYYTDPTDIILFMEGATDFVRELIANKIDKL